MEDKESQQFNPEILNFPNDRKNLVIEIGTGGPATLMLRDIPNYLKENYANYLGIESDALGHKKFTDFVKNPSKNIDYAREVHASVFDVAGELSSKADTVWIRNFRGLGMKKDSVLEGNVANAAYEMLKLGGELIIINTYDVLPEGGVEKVREALEKVGFNVEPIDLEREIHPFVAGFRRLDEQLPPDIGPKPTKYGFKATK
jgi:hypothetical protein